MPSKHLEYLIRPNKEKITPTWFLSKLKNRFLVSNTKQKIKIKVEISEIK